MYANSYNFKIIIILCKSTAGDENDQSVIIRSVCNVLEEKIAESFTERMVL